MPGSVGAAVQVTPFGLIDFAGRAGRARGPVGPGSERAEDRLEAPHDRLLAADHLAIAALLAPDAAADADIDIVQPLRPERLGAPDVVVIIGVAAVDDDVAAFEQRDELGENRVHDPGWDHEPDRSGLRKLRDEIMQVG